MREKKKSNVSDTPFAYLVGGMRHEYPRGAKSFTEESREKSVPEESVHFALCRKCAWIGKLRLLGSLIFWSFGHDFLELDFLELDFLAHKFCMVAHFPVHVHDGIECA